MTKQIQQNLIAMLMFIIMLGFAYFKYLVKPLDIKQKEAIVKLEEIKSKLDTLKRRAIDLPRLEREMEILKYEVSDLELTLPKEINTQDILRVVTKQSQQCNVQIQNFIPMALSSQNNYNEIPFNITCTGNFHSVARFLAEMGQESRIFSAENVVMNSNLSGSTKDFKSIISVSFILKAYAYK